MAKHTTVLSERPVVIAIQEVMDCWWVDKEHPEGGVVLLC